MPSTAYPPPRNQDVNILLVDDDPFILKIMGQIISQEKYSYTCAHDGKEAVDKLKNSPFDIVITDINMPNMDGMELLKYITGFHPQTGVIVATGYSEMYSYVDVIDAGAIDYMTKPFDGNELLAKLRRVIKEQTLIKRLEQISICDSLTKLYNRRYFDIKITDEAHRASRQHYSMFLTFIDIDNFKSFNDTKGHQAGDHVLETLGGIMMSCGRRGLDWTFRYGGDEFALLTTQTTVEQTRQINERIRSAYHEQNFSGTSLSFGIAKFHRNPEINWSDNIKKFIKKADQTMYQAKERGKNQIITED